MDQPITPFYIPILRRTALAGALGACVALTLPGCQTLPAFTLEEAVRRLLLRSTDRAFARLTARGGYWDRAVGMIGLPQFLGVRGEILAGILTAPPVKARLESAFADIAEESSYRAAPVVTDAVRVIGIANARAIIDGGPRAATEMLRGHMGMRLIDAMVPEIGTAIRLAEDPAVGHALALLTGIDAAALARSIAGRMEEAIWREIGEEEAAIRADPASANDPAIVTVFASGANRAP